MGVPSPDGRDFLTELGDVIERDMSIRRVLDPLAGAVTQQIGRNREDVAIELLEPAEIALARQALENLLRQILRLSEIAHPPLEELHERRARKLVALSVRALRFGCGQAGGAAAGHARQYMAKS